MAEIRSGFHSLESATRKRAAWHFDPEPMQVDDFIERASRFERSIRVAVSRWNRAGERKYSVKKLSNGNVAIGRVK